MVGVDVVGQGSMMGFILLGESIYLFSLISAKTKR